VKLDQLSVDRLRQQLQGPGLVLGTGPFTFRIRSSLAAVAEGLATLYPAYPVLPGGQFADFPVDIAPGAGLHRWIRRQARFLYDGAAVFEPLPADHAFPLLEWAMNWCISTQANQYLMLHAAVLARDDRALLLPAPPGSGKSTLCAALVHSGWRLLSDELALLSPDDGWVTPLARPVSLKNASIDVLRRFAPQAVLNQVSHGTAKGSVCHMQVPAWQLAEVHRRARVCWVVFPRYQAGADTLLAPRSRAASVVELARNAFNYTLHGRPGFDLLADVVQASSCHDFTYSRLDEAMATFDRLAADGA
jgi:HprK-related kinase A